MGKLLPENWVETEFGRITSKPQYGWTTKSTDLGRVKYLRTTDLSKRKLNWDNVPFCQTEPDDILKYQIYNDDILISRAGSVGLSYRAVNPPQNAVFASYLIRFKPLINAKLIEYYLQSAEYFREISDASAGIAVQNINALKLSNLRFPLPPLPEQQRIVDKLNILFKQLEIIRKAIDNIPQLLKNFRQQILNNALSGKLIDGVSEKKILKEFLSDVKYGTSRKADYDNDGIPTFRIPNIVNGGIDDKDMKFVKLPEKEYEQLKLRERDILIIRSNGSVSLVGKSAIVQKKFEKYVYAGYLIRLRCKTQLDPEFLNYSLNSDFCRNQIVEFAHSMNGINNINADQIRNLYILIYPLEIQQKIVEKIKCLFAKSDIIEQGYIRLKQKIDKLPQAILHKAFKGELVEQLPTDGDARELLKEIEQLKTTIQKR